MRSPELIFLALLALTIFPNVEPVISNKYITFYIPEYSRRYLYLEGKFSYSVQLVLHKGESQNQNIINATNSPEFVEFIVKAPEYSYYSIIAIIQNIHFRMDQNVSICRDYLQFFAEGSEMEPSPKICGRLPRGNSEAEPSALKGPRTYFSSSGSIRLRAHVDSTLDLNSELNTIGAEIVFTAYTTCPETEVGLKTLQRCSSSSSISCIPSSLFCDSKIDCGLGSDFGRDEEKCYFPYIYAGAGLLVIAFILLLIFGFIQWVRKKAKRNAEAAANASYSAAPVSSDEGGGDPGMCEAVDMDASMAAF